MVHSVRMLTAAAAVAMVLAGCGGGKTNTATTTTTTVAAPTTEAQRESAALPQEHVQPVPADLNCGAVKPVWVNTHTKAYHEAGDPYYGRTKNGKYMCPSAAAAEGDHPAGARHKGVSAESTDAGTTTGAATGHKKHHKKSEAPNY